MAVTALGHVLLLALLVLAVRGDDQYSIPEVKVEAFTPKGFRVTLPDAPNIKIFAVQGLLVRKDSSAKIDIAGETASKVHVDNKAYWIVELADLELQVGDKLDYLVFVAVNSAGYIRDGLKFDVKPNVLKEYKPVPTTPKYVEISTTTTTKPCRSTQTRVRSADTVCAGDTIFEENFDSLRGDIWQEENYIPTDHPEVPFVSYQSSAVSVKDGNLHITPSQQVNATGSLYGSLDLGDRCTSGDSRQCSVVAGPNIPVPPVISGRIISKPGFAFTYGTVSVRAKLPKGDWIYPEILLEPLMKKFTIGSTNTGILKIASARGNADLPLIGNKVLYSGPVLNTKCHDALFFTKKADTFWSDDFHVYSVQWTPERLVLAVDGEEYGRLESATRGLRQRLPFHCGRGQGSGIAPFNEHFYLTLGLAVGGNAEFPDSNDENFTKPWKNLEAKAPLKFWSSAQTWQGTWQQPELVVDYVKVVAL